MCETFKWIELLAVELQKDGLQIPVKNFFGQMIASDARAFQSTLKMQISDHPPSISFYGFDIYFSMRRMYIEDITRWREDMNFMFEWQQQYLTSERSERVRYCSCHENIKFISSSHRVMFFLLYGD